MNIQHYIYCRDYLHCYIDHNLDQQLYNLHNDFFIQNCMYHSNMKHIYLSRGYIRDEACMIDIIQLNLNKIGMLQKCKYNIYLIILLKNIHLGMVYNDFLYCYIHKRQCMMYIIQFNVSNFCMVHYKEGTGLFLPKNRRNYHKEYNYLSSHSIHNQEDKHYKDHLQHYMKHNQN